MLGARLELRGRHAHVRRVRVGGAEALRAKHQVDRRLKLPLSNEDLQPQNNDVMRIVRFLCSTLQWSTTESLVSDVKPMVASSQLQLSDEETFP